MERLVPLAAVGRLPRAELLCGLAHLRARRAPHRLAGDRDRDLRRGGRARRVARAGRAGGDPLLLGGSARPAPAGAGQRRDRRERARRAGWARAIASGSRPSGRRGSILRIRAGVCWFPSGSGTPRSPACATCPTSTARARASASTSTRRAAAARSAPVLLQIHGGGWTIGNKRQQALPLMMHLSRRGWVCVAANYRLSPRATFPDHLIDVKQALRWIRENIAEYGGDPGFVAITGGSAGGHLSALAALTGESPRVPARLRRRRHLRAGRGAVLRRLRLHQLAAACDGRGAGELRRAGGDEEEARGGSGSLRARLADALHLRRCPALLHRARHARFAARGGRRAHLQPEAARGLARAGRLRGAARARSTPSSCSTRRAPTT